MANLLTRVDQISYKKFCIQPVAKLCFLVSRAINDNKKLMSILGGTNSIYNRDDWDIRETPGVSIFYDDKTKIDTSSQFWFKRGKISLKFQFPSDQVRDRMHEVTATMIDAVDTYFQSLDTFYSIEAQLPGLRDVGYSTSWDASKSEKLDQSQLLILTGTLSFSIDLLVWRNYIIETQGADPIDPCTTIYSDVTGYELFVTPNVFPGG